MKYAKFSFVTGIAIAAISLTAGLMPKSAIAHNIAAEIEKIRLATQKFKDVKVAQAEGYVPAPPGKCISAAGEGLPPEWGAMGIHYINPPMLKITATAPRVDGKSTHTDFTNPAIQLYEPQADGSLALAGVEILVFLDAWHEAGNQAPPKTAGRIWDTMADNASTPQDESHGFEPHHDQHMYFRTMASQKNQLAPFTPRVTCKYDN